MRQVRKFKRPAARFRKIAIGMAAVLAGLVAAALILPGYIDWNRFRGEIEHQASAITGRQVRIEGAISFSMLPRPALSLENATLANSVGATAPVMLSLERLEAQLGMLALLSGKIQVANFRLIAPVLNLETLPDGSHNWAWQTDAKNSRPGIRFDNVLVERGSLRYRNHVSGNDIVTREMDLQLSAGSLQGPFTAKGSLRLQDVAIRIDAALGSFAPGRTTSLTIKSVLPGGAAIDFTGGMTADGGVTGSLNSQGADLTGLIASVAQLGAPALSGVRPAILRHAYRIESSLAVAANSLKFDKVKLSLGDNTLTGSLAVDTQAAPTFTAALNASSLDLDALQTAVAPSATAQPAPENSFIIPHDVSGVLRFTGNAVRLRGGNIRDIIFATTVADGIATLDELGAQLPGSTATRISGKLTTARGQPQFIGKVDLRSENLRGLLGWLGVEAPDMPERSLSRAELAAELDLSPELAQLNEIVAEIDSSNLTGSLVLAMRERTALGIDLNIDQLNADNYLLDKSDPVQNATPTDHSTLDAAPAPIAGSTWGAARTLIDSHDSNFKLTVKALTYRGVPITRLQADGSVINGALAINSFTVADMAGTAFSISGVLSNLATAMQGEINLRLASNDLGGFARTIGVTLPVPGAQLGKSSVEAKFLLANAGVEAAINAFFGETSLQVSGGVNGLAPGMIAAAGEQTMFQARLSLASPSLRKFAAQAGLDIFPTDAEETAGLALSAALAHTNGEISISALNGAIGTIPVQGQAIWNTTGPKPVLRAEVTAGEILLDHFLQAAQPTGAGIKPPNRQLPWSGAPLELSYLDQLEADVRLDAGRFSARGYDITRPSMVFEIRNNQASLKKFTGSLFGGEASATASLHRGVNVPEFTAEWNLKGADMEAASAALSGAPAITGSLDFSGKVKGAGASSFALVSSLEGQARITGIDGFIRGIDLPEFSARLASLERAADFVKIADSVLQGGNTPYKRISVPFTIAEGVAQSSNPVISIASVTGALEASIDLPRYWLNAEASLTLNDHMNAPPLGIAYIGSLNNPERSLRTDRLENYFTQTLMSKSLERVINNRNAQTAPAVAIPPPAPPVPQQAPPPPAPREEGTARKVLNGILNGIMKDNPK
ncbi:MAG: AsmA family protein [Pseudomonadota bacterium]